MLSFPSPLQQNALQYDLIDVSDEKKTHKTLVLL